MPLDMFGQAQADTDAYVRANNSPHLPAGFGDVFQANWNENRLFGQSIAGANARQSAMNDYLDEVTKKTGERFADLPAELGSPSLLMPFINDKVAKLKEANPDLGIDPLTEDELNRRAVAQSRQSRADLEEMNQREKTLGGSLGGLAGGAAGALTDPVNLVAAPLAAPEGLGLLATSLAWAGIAGGSQAAIEAVGSPYRDTVQPGYSQSGEPARNILGATAMGGAIGGSFKALGMAWTRAKTGVWPRSVRDAGNVVESEANVAQTNVLPGIEGEVAHRDALAKSIDQILSGQRVDVEIGEASRELMARLEREAPFSLPVMNEHAIRLTSEEAGLQSRNAELATRLESLPQGDPAAAETLARLQQVEQQIAEAPTAEARKAASARRDELLTNTNPETLQAAAAPLEQRRAVETEQASISKRLSDIAAERANLTPDTLPVNLGQRQYVPRTLFDIHEARLDGMMVERAGARSAAEEAAAARTEVAPELPLEPTRAEAHEAKIADGVSSIAQRAGYDMPREEAEKIAKMVAGASTDEQARAILSTVADRPRTVSEFPPSPLPKAPEVPAPRGELTPATVEKTLGSPDHEAALRADIDRARATGDVKIPAGVDEKGEPIYRSLDGAMDEIDAYKAAADQIKACANPQPEPAEAP